MKTCALVTYGCKVNQYDTQALREQLERAGYTEVAPDQPADVYVLNSCTVTRAADSEALTQARRLRGRQPQATIIATGCFAETGQEAFTAAGVTTVIPHRLKHRLVDFLDPGPDLLDAATEATPMGAEQPAYVPLRISRFTHRTRAFLKVQDGCRFRCAYCRVPFVRGDGVSRDVTAIVAEAARLLDAGHREIVLTGVCLGSFGHDRRQMRALPDVMARLAALPGEFRLRLSSIEPWGITPEVLRVMAASPRWCQHLHIPFQSGSDAVLQRMSRPGSRAWYQRLVDQIRGVMPAMALSADLIVGFPGETEEEFAASIELMQHVELMRVHWFSFSPRVGTAGMDLPGQLSRACIQDRMRWAQSSYVAHRATQARAVQGTEAVVLAEEAGGYTASYHRVRWAEQVTPSTFVHAVLNMWDGETFLAVPTTPR